MRMKPLSGLCTNRLSWVEGGMSIGEVGVTQDRGEGGRFGEEG